ncbi:MAG: hypothetical protein ACLU5I_01775 [Alistipes finegoldii]
MVTPEFRRGRFFLSSSLAFILCGDLLCGTSGDLSISSRFYHDVFDAESFGDFAQFGETFPSSASILHISISKIFSKILAVPGVLNSPAR